MSEIFVSYRKTESDITGRIADRLIAAFGEESVFLDVDNIPVGQDFRIVIDNAIRKSNCVAIVIGEGWIRASVDGGDTSGNLQDESDFVRLEVRSALASGIPLLPVLVGEVEMPNAGELPADIKELAFRNATRVRSGRDFRQGINYLVESMIRIDGIEPSNDRRGSTVSEGSRGAPRHSLAGFRSTSALSSYRSKLQRWWGEESDAIT